MGLNMIRTHKKSIKDKITNFLLLGMLGVVLLSSKSLAFEQGGSGNLVKYVLNLQGKNSEDVLSGGSQYNYAIAMDPNAEISFEMVFYFYVYSWGTNVSAMGYAEGTGGEWEVNMPEVNNLGIASESIRNKSRWAYRFKNMKTGEIVTVTWGGPGLCQTSNPTIVSVSCSGRFFNMKNVSDAKVLSENTEIVSDYLSYKINDTQKLYTALGMNKLAMSDAVYQMAFVSRFLGIDDGRSGVYYSYGVIGGGCTINVNPIVVDFKTISNYSEQELANISDVSLGNVNCTWDKVERPYYRFNIEMNGTPELKNENNDVLGFVKGSLNEQAACTDDDLISPQGQIYQNNTNGDVLSSWVLCKKEGASYPNAGEYTASGIMNIYLP